MKGVLQGGIIMVLLFILLKTLDIIYAGVVLGTIAVLALVLVITCTYAVPTNEVWTLERLGRPVKVLRPGGHFLVPFIDAVGRKVSTDEVALNIPEQEVVTLDDVPVVVAGIVYYRIFDAIKAAYQVADLQGALRDMAQAQFRARVRRCSHDDAMLLQTQSELGDALLEKLGNMADAPLGVQVRGVEIQVFTV